MIMGEIVDKLRSMEFEQVYLPKCRYDTVLQVSTHTKKEIRVFLHELQTRLVMKVVVIVPEWRNPSKRIEPRKFENPELMFDYVNELFCAEVLIA